MAATDDTAVPNSYSDPYWTQLASTTESQLGLPPGLLSAVVTHGEKSNNDQVSSAGAKTPFQITPSTRDAVLKRDGIDAYLSPQNAAEVAGLVLKDGLNWAKGQSDDPDAQARLAAGFYHAGGDPANWGPKTHAYVARVDQGLQSNRVDALQNDFATFMKANPPDAPSPAGLATAAAMTSPTTPAANDALAQDFAAWHSTQAPPPMPATSAQAPAGPSLGDQVQGAGEAALSAVTSPFAYARALTSVLGTYGGAALARINGDTRDYLSGVDPEQVANAAGAQWQYTPRTALGQDYAQTLAEALTPLAGMNPLEASLISSARAPISGAARAVPSMAVDSATAAGNAIRSRYAAMMGRGDADAGPTAGTMGSAGAAGTDVALQRQATADALPVPMKLTTGQATRAFDQQQFEGETAKNPTVGEPLRENAALQNQQLAANFDALADLTGAQQASDLEGARALTQTVRDAAARSKTAYNAKYAAARAAGELEEPVSLQGVIDHLNESAPEATTAPILATARSLAIKLGIAKAGEDGDLVALPPKGAVAPPAAPARSSLFGEASTAPAPEPGASLATAEQFRKAVIRNTGYDPANQRQASIINGLIDNATEGKGGDLYAQARAAYARHQQLFVNNAIVNNLLAMKRGTADRKVALDDVMHGVVIGGSRDDLSMLRRTLDVADQRQGLAPGTVGPGRQAWNEVQGATLRYIADQAGATGKNAARDVAGRPIISYAGLNKAVRELDKSGKLDFILGKKDAQTVRDIAEIASVVKTVPPGAVNTSNTAATLLAALGEAGGMHLFTGLPLPLVSIGRMLKQYRDRAVLEGRVAQALRGVTPTTQAANDGSMRIVAPPPRRP